MYSSPFPPCIVSVWIKHENSKAEAADLDIDRFPEEWHRWESNDQIMEKPSSGPQPKLRFLMAS